MSRSSRAQRLQKNERRLTRPRPDGPKLLRDLQHGIERLIAGDLDGAEARLMRVLARKKDHPVALHHMGLLLLRRGEPARAARAIERATVADPDQNGVWLSLGEARAALGESDRALAAYRTAHERAPDDADAAFTLGKVLLEARQLDEAETLLRRTVALAPRAPEAHDLLGQVLRLKEDRQGARLAFERAFRLQPEAPMLQYHVGRALLEEDRPSEGRPLLESAARHMRDDHRVQRDLGRARLLMHELEPAFEVLQRALELAPDDAITHVFLGWCHEYRGEREAMERHYRRGMELDPGITGPWYKMARMGHLREPEEIEALIPTYSGKESGRSDFFFALGEIYRRRGEHARAFQHYAEGNARAGVKHDRARQVFLAREVIEHCTPSLFAERAGWGDATDAPVFVVGMPRSGTSLIEQILGAHPAVLPTGENPFCGDTALQLRHIAGTPNAFPLALAELAPEAVSVLAQGYWTTVGELPDGVRRFVDKAPGNYLMLGLIALMFPNARVIHARRHPLDTIVSCYFTNFGQGRCSSTYDLEDLASAYADYLALMEHWRAALPLEMLEVDYEDLVTDLEPGARSMVEFCGLEWDPACLAYHESERVCYTASLHQVRKPAYTSSVGRWKHYERELAPVIERLGLDARREGETRPAGDR